MIARTQDPRTEAPVQVLFPEAKQRARRRRLRLGLAALLALLVAAGVTFIVTPSSKRSTTHVGAPPLGQPRPGLQLYTAVGTIIADPGHHQPAEICGGILASLPPGCGSGVVLRNLDIRHVPTVRTMGSITFTDQAIRVVGTYRDGELTLTQKPQINTTVQAGDAGPNELPCPTPANGWSSKILPGRYATAFYDYGLAHPTTFGGFWVTYNQQIAVVSVTRDVAQARQELRRFYPGNLCVTKAAHTQRQLLLISGGIMPAPGHPNPLRIFSTSADIISSKVDVGLVVDDANVEQILKARYPAGIIRLHPFLIPIHE